MAKTRKDESQKILKRLYSIPEAAIYLGRTDSAIREMLWAVKIPFARDGKRILIDIQDMDERIEKSKADVLVSSRASQGQRCANHSRRVHPRKSF